MTDLEVQQEIIKMCNKIYQHYAEQKETNRKIDWEEFWNKTEPFMESHFGEDAIGMAQYQFMQFQFKHVFRQLQVLEGLLWPIKK